jgi:hypothetical protein
MIGSGKMMEPDEPGEMPGFSSESHEDSRLARLEKLNAFGMALARTRKEAIDGRRQLGIEDEWTEDEDAYDGIDDANRDQSKSAWRTRPVGKLWPKTQQNTRSTVFVDITRPYVDSAAARIADMLLPVDEFAFGLDPTPIPQLMDAAKSQQMVQGPDGQPIPEADIAQAMLDEAKKRAESAEKRIQDWLAESGWPTHVRSIIEDAARVGTGILKGPCPTKRKQTSWSVQDGIGSLQVVEQIEPGSRRIDYWDFFPDPACGECIHDGSYVWERDRITYKQMMDLIGLPGYIPEQILACLKEGPQSAEYTEGRDEQIEQSLGVEKTRFEIWYYYGLADAEDMSAAGCECEEGQKVPVMVTMVNNRVIKAIMNPLDTGEYPYDLMIWQKRPGIPWGRGVARQIRTPQRMLNAAFRNMMDNAAMAAGPMVVAMQNIVSPADGQWTIAPRKIWTVNEGATVDDARKAFISVDIPMRQAEIQNIIMLALRMAEESTGLPMILQGQMGQKAPDTVGGMTMLQNNASAVLRRLSRTFDDQVTKPHVRRYYDWLMQYGEDPNEKGDYQIIAKGSSALVERDLQNQELVQMAMLVENPAFGIDPKKYAEEWLKSRRFDPRRFKYSEEEEAAMQEQAAQMPPDPRVMVAQMKQEFDAMKLQFEANQRDKDRQLEMAMKQVDAQLEAMKLNADQQVSMAQVRGMLQKAMMDINSKHQLFAAESRMKMATGNGI